jgi:hypothetical protein
MSERTILDLQGNIIDIADLGSCLLRKATVHLSSADILAVHTTPVTLVAAPGTGKRLLWHRVGGSVTFATSAYVAAGTGAGVKSGVGTIVSLEALLEASSSSGWDYAPPADQSWSLGTVDQPLVISASDPITLGDGTLDVTVWYSVEDVP